MKLDPLLDEVALTVQLVPTELLPVESLLLVSLSGLGAIHHRRTPPR
jgi:hypothetical protein